MFLVLPKSSNNGIFLSYFQMVLQGCIGPTVNQGPIEVAKVFLGDLLEGNKKEPTNHQKTLRICFKDFKEKWVIVVYISRAGGRFLAHFKEFPPLEQLLFSSLLGRKKIGYMATAKAVELRNFHRNWSWFVNKHVLSIIFFVLEFYFFSLANDKKTSVELFSK